MKQSTTLSEALQLVARQAKQIEEQQQLIATQASKVRFADAISGANTHITISDMAKLLRQNGVHIGRNRLYDWLVRHKYLTRRQRWSKTREIHVNDYMPTQRAADLEIFFIEELPIVGSSEAFLRHTVKVTGKGQLYFTIKHLIDPYE